MIYVLFQVCGLVNFKAGRKMDPDAPSSSSDLILRNRRIVRRSSAGKYAKSPADNCARSSLPEIPVVARSPELSRQDALKLRQGLTSVNLSAEMKRKKFPGSSSNSPSTPCPNKLGYREYLSSSWKRSYSIMNIDMSVCNLNFCVFF